MKTQLKLSNILYHIDKLELKNDLKYLDYSQNKNKITLLEFLLDNVILFRNVFDYNNIEFNELNKKLKIDKYKFEIYTYLINLYELNKKTDKIIYNGLCYWWSGIGFLFFDSLVDKKPIVDEKLLITKCLNLSNILNNKLDTNYSVVSIYTDITNIISKEYLLNIFNLNSSKIPNNNKLLKFSNDLLSINDIKPNRLMSFNYVDNLEESINEEDMIDTYGKNILIINDSTGLTGSYLGSYSDQYNEYLINSNWLLLNKEKLIFK